ncbi:MAG TPA: outer membrane beta-barrel protein [Steroidobacteraceae bacterium]|nr:outer membrane beta-barrel protein [Steroidobacteraceae bacterium]
MALRYANSRRPARGARSAGLVLLALAAAAARADDLLGPYAGATFGKATLDATTGLVSGFGSDKSAYQLIVGLRPVAEVAAELEYVDFGHASGLSTYSNSNVTLSSGASRKGLAAFGLLYLPTPLVDFYLKAGLARLHTRADTTIVGCPAGGVCPPLARPSPVNSTDTGIAGGAGVMYRIASFELRGEYQRFSALGGDPWLLTFGGTWTF